MRWFGDDVLYLYSAYATAFLGGFIMGLGVVV
jgi:hypothetical protein